MEGQEKLIEQNKYNQQEAPTSNVGTKWLNKFKKEMVNKQAEEKQVTQMHFATEHIHFPETWERPCTPLPKHEGKVVHMHHMRSRHAMAPER